MAKATETAKAEDKKDTPAKEDPRRDTSNSKRTKAKTAKEIHREYSQKNKS